MRPAGFSFRVLHFPIRHLGGTKQPPVNGRPVFPSSFFFQTLECISDSGSIEQGDKQGIAIWVAIGIEDLERRSYRPS